VQGNPTNPKTRSIRTFAIVSTLASKSVDVINKVLNQLKHWHRVGLLVQQGGRGSIARRSACKRLFISFRQRKRFWFTILVRNSGSKDRRTTRHYQAIKSYLYSKRRVGAFARAIRKGRSRLEFGSAKQHPDVLIYEWDERQRGNIVLDPMHFFRVARGCTNSHPRL